MKKKGLLCLIVLVISGFLLLGLGLSQNWDKEDDSFLYNHISAYWEGADWVFPEENPFPPNSAEDNLLHGIEQYQAGEIDEALNYLTQAQQQPFTDPLFPCYLNFYLNKCLTRQIGHGDPELVQTVLDTIQTYPKLSNDTTFIWEMLSTLRNSTESRSRAIQMVDQFREETRWLSDLTELKLKGNAAILKMMNENYGESLYTFYEIISESEQVSSEDDRILLQARSREYIGNMNFILGNYQSAIKQYDQIIDLQIDDPEYSAFLKYSSYINRSSSYFHLSEYEKAQESVMELSAQFSYLSPNLLHEAKIFVNNNLAMIAIEQGDLEKAEEHLAICDELLQNKQYDPLMNNDIYVTITRCELLIQQGNPQQALQILDTLSIQNRDNELSFEASVYPLLMRIYQETGQTERYLETYSALLESTENLNRQLKEDYFNFVENSYMVNQLQHQKRISQFTINVLVALVSIILVLIVMQLIRIQRLRQSNLIDSLTNVYNRKYITDVLYKRLRHSDGSILMGVIMVDIDYFKNYNDSYGHLYGDKVIQEVADVLTSSLRKSDTVIRYGGEEFLLLLENISSGSMDIICQRLLDNMEVKNIPHLSSPTADHVTLSIGAVRSVIHSPEELKQAINIADHELYQAKFNGRNQFQIYSENDFEDALENPISSKHEESR
jgi:diguanylate cyclase (GGDEF)-like protein